MKKKLTAMLLIMSMVCTFLPVSAMAEEAAPAGNEAAVVSANGNTTEYATLQGAIDAAQDGETVKLLKDVTTTSTYSSDTRYSIGIKDKSITLDGQDKFTLDVSNTQRGFYVEGGSDAQAPKQVTFQNITIKNKTSLGRCIDTRGGYMNLTLDHVNLDLTESNDNSQALTIGGDHRGLDEGYLMPVTIKNSTITTNDAGYGIVTFNPVDMTIENSNITGYAALFLKGPDSSTGSRGSRVDIVNGSVLTGNNPHTAESNSSFGTICVDDINIIVNVQDSKIVTNATNSAEQYTFSFNTKANKTGQVNISGNSIIKLMGDNAFFNNIYPNAEVQQQKTTITGGTFTKDNAPLDVTDYLDANLTQNPDGTIVPMDAADATAKVGNDYYKSLIAAVKAVNNGETVTLLKDTNDNVTIPQGKNLTLDLNGKTLSNDSMYSLVVDGGKLTVTDSTAGQPVVGDDNNTVTYLGSGMIKNTFNNNGEAKAIQVQNGGVLNLQGGTVYCLKGSGIFAIGDKKGNTAVASTIHMTGGYVEAQEYGIGVSGKGATLTMDGGVVKARDNAAVGGNGSNTENNRCGGTTITINGGTLIGNIQSAGYVACGIYHPQEGNLTVNGGNIYVHGGAGILARSGAATINNVNIVTTGNTTGKVGDSRVVVPCSAVVVDEDAKYPGGNLDATINGGEFVSEEGVSNVTLVGNTNDKLTVSGGSFSAPVPQKNLDPKLNTEVKAPGKNPDAPYSYFEKQEEALEYAKDDKDATVQPTKPVADSVTLTFNLNEGQGAPASVTVAKDGTVVLPTPSRDGYRFDGWAAQNGQVYAGGSSLKVESNMVLTALWSIPSTPSKPSYQITVPSVDNGSVTVSPDKAKKGELVTITVTPDAGYIVDVVAAVDKNGQALPLTDKGNGTYTFTMPASKVEITVTFKKEAVQPSELPFKDVAQGDWFYNAVSYVYGNGLMSGMDATTFAPNANLSRAMMAQVLYNMEGKPAAEGGNFSDVASGDWYANAVNWAAKEGIVAGMGDGTFAPNANLTREQMAAILYRYANYKGIDTAARGSLAAFSDAYKVSDWAKDSMSWAVGTKLVSGMGDSTLAPQGLSTRAQVANVLMNFCENVAK